MTKTVIGVVTVACLGLPAMVLTATMGGGGACVVTTVPDPSGPPAGTGLWDAGQLAVAATIIDRGTAKHISSWGQTIALAVAMQESHLRNLPYLGDRNDHDSIGVFQQRPSQGWGTPTELADPAHQADRFYDKLVTVPGWESMPLTQAAQAVQRSAYPDAYAKWTGDALRLVARAVSPPGSAVPAHRDPCVSACVGITAADSAGCAGIATVFGRARSWLTAWSGGPVPYLSSGDPRDWYQGYRRDCSGYVSMALGLEGPGANTSGLAARSTTIGKPDLRPGDLLINTAPDLRGHVVLFERWADESMASYYGYEQSGDGGTHHRVIPYPYFGDYPMAPYRLGR